MSSPRRVAGAVVVLLTLAACDTNDGRTLEPPPPGATAPPFPASTTATTATLGTPPVGSGETASLALSSASFVDGGAIPSRLSSCDGEDVSPALAWTGVPPDAVELALTVVDPDVPGTPFVHWVVAGIDPVVEGFDEGGLPESALELQPWTGPCPPAGETHDYVVTLYALSEPAGLAADSGPEVALAALESTPGPTAILRGTYARSG